MYFFRQNSLTEEEKSGTIFKRIIITNVRSHRFKKSNVKNTEVLFIWQQKDQEKI